MLVEPLELLPELVVEPVVVVVVVLPVSVVVVVVVVVMEALADLQ